MIRLGRYEFRPGLWPSIIFVILLPLFLLLGNWQLQRAEEKEQILERVDQKGQMATVALEHIDPEQDVYRKVLLKGEFLIDRQLLLDNRIYQGRAGYDILTPFRLAQNGRIVLVNRGWVEAGLSRSVPPDIAFDPAAYSDITGIYTTPSRGFVLKEQALEDDGLWPRVVQYPDYAGLGKILGTYVLPGIVQADGDIGGDYPVLWQPVASGPEKHYAYAMQWFSFAVLLCGLYVGLNCRKVEHDNL